RLSRPRRDPHRAAPARGGGAAPREGADVPAPAPVAAARSDCRQAQPDVSVRESVRSWVARLRIGPPSKCCARPDASRRGPAASLAFDARRGRVVLFGGRWHEDLVTTRYDETWEWDGSAWTKRPPAQQPLARSIDTLLWDEARGGVVLCGGYEGFPLQGCGQLSDRREWDGTAWTQVVPDRAPLVGVVASDDARQSIVLFDSTRRGTTSEWTGHQWVPASPAVSPAPRFGPAMALDRKSVV